MRRSKAFFGWLTTWVLLSMLGVGILGGASLSVRAAPRVKPLEVCPDPTIAQWTFTGAVAPIIPPPSSGSGTLVAGSGINGPTYPSGQSSSESPAISFTGWNSPGLDQDDYLEYQIDTSGMNSISLSFKSRVSNTGPTNLELHYSIDSGASYIPFGSITPLTNDESWNLLSFDLTSISSDVDNKSDIRFRLYAYGASGGSGTWRLDNITFLAVCPPPPGTILISEVAWAGTAANTDHEWIELRNPGTKPVDITGWSLQAADGNPNIPLNGTIPAGGFFLLERNEDAVANIMADQLYDFNNTLSNSGEVLILYDNSGTPKVIDTANSNGGGWPAGSVSTFGTMERIGTLSDKDKSWSTNNGVVKNGVDANGNPIWGTPKNINAPTPTATLPPTAPPTPVNSLAVVISEVAWAGTQSSSDDEWIELYNPGTRNINLSGWVLRSSDNSPNINLSGTLSAGGYFLLERTDDDTVTDVDADLIYTGSLSNGGEILYLYDPSGFRVDTANSNGGAWPAGISSTYSSMERSIIATDSNFSWVTYDASKDDPDDFAHDASGNNIKGTPGRGNKPFNVTPTPTPGSGGGSSGGSSGGGTGTITLPPILGISEFLPRPGYDWNNDGIVDVFDEFIEIINAGQIDVNLSSYRLDDEQNLGSVAYPLPAVTLKPGERAVFYAAETGILLSDAGDTVRLLRGSTVVDAYTYGVVRYPDQSWCRIPDRLGYWNDPCFPTPGNPNALTGNFPLPPEGPTGYLPSVCLLPDTAPEVFVYAECEVGGDKIWNRQYWDMEDDTEPVKLEEPQKWETIFE